MEIKINRNELFKCISRVQSIIERKTSMPIISTVLLNASGSEVQVSATNLEIGLQQIIHANVVNEGSITISGRKLFEILKESKSSDFHIKEKESNWVAISDGVAHFKLACLPADEFPEVVRPEEVSMIEADGDILSEMINKTIYSVTREEISFKLSGVFTEKIVDGVDSFLKMVATDGHRLSMVEKKITGLETLELDNGVVIPKKSISELNKLASEGGPIQIGFKDKSCVAKKENVLLVIRLIEAKFPDYQPVVDREEKYSIKVKRVSIMEAMRKMLILSNERYRGVTIILENDNMELISTNPDLGEGQENLDVEYQGEQLKAGFNPQYFIETLQSMESEEVSLGFIDSLKPCSVTGDADKGFLGLLMPMKV